MSASAAKQEIEVIEQSGRALTPMDMINQAVERGSSIEVIEKMMGLQERWEANQARKAFDNAMASAKAEMPVIFKGREVDFTSAKGRTNYRYEDLAGIARIVDPILTKFGLSYRYRTATEQGVVTVTCIVSHRDGHSEENSLSAGRDDTGNKNSIQQVGSTITYLQRYTLKAALGLATSNDDDAKATADDGERISEKQVTEIIDLLEAHGKDRAKFLKWAKVASVDDIPVAKFDSCVAAIKRVVA